MLENFPNLNEWMSLRDKVLEKGLETGCRVMVKISEKTMEFLELAEQHFPAVKDVLDPWLARWRQEVEAAPCCQEAQPEESQSPESQPVPAADPSMQAVPEAPAAPADAPVPVDSSEPAREAPPVPAAAGPLAEALRELPEDILIPVFSRNQLLKVLYLMALSGKKWLLAQEIAEVGDELGFPILPQNIRKVIQQKAVDAGLVRVRERADSRRGAKEFHLTSKGESYLKSEFQLG